MKKTFVLLTFSLVMMVAMHVHALSQAEITISGEDAAATFPGLTVISIGDSYAADPNPWSPDFIPDNVLRERFPGYPVATPLGCLLAATTSHTRVADALGVSYVQAACSTAKLQGEGHTLSNITDQLRAVHEYFPDALNNPVILVSGGGNDVAFDGVYDMCAIARNCEGAKLIFERHLNEEKVIEKGYQALSELITSLDIDSRRVFIVEYPSMTYYRPPFQTHRAFCDPVTGPFIETFIQTLNAKLQEVARLYGFSYVGGIYDAFAEGHGFCTGIGAPINFQESWFWELEFPPTEITIPPHVNTSGELARVPFILAKVMQVLAPTTEIPVDDRLRQFNDVVETESYGRGSLRVICEQSATTPQRVNATADVRLVGPTTGSTSSSQHYVLFGTPKERPDTDVFTTPLTRLQLTLDDRPSRPPDVCQYYGFSLNPASPFVVVQGMAEYTINPGPGLLPRAFAGIIVGNIADRRDRIDNGPISGTIPVLGFVGVLPIRQTSTYEVPVGWGLVTSADVGTCLGNCTASASVRGSISLPIAVHSVFADYLILSRNPALTNFEVVRYFNDASDKLELLQVKINGGLPESGPVVSCDRCIVTRARHAAQTAIIRHVTPGEWPTITVRSAGATLEIQANAVRRTTNEGHRIEGEGIVRVVDIHVRSAAVADPDGDLIIDSTDNCPLVWNPLQTDSDDDGTGDECESLEIRCSGHTATIVGTSGDDVLIGTDGDDVIVGLEGDDYIDGLAGHDIICGGPGRDILWGGSGPDWLFGEDGDDTLLGCVGPDLLMGGPGDDILLGGIGNDRLFGEAGDDALNGGAGADLLMGGPGHDTLLGGLGNDLLFGGADNDNLFGGEGDDVLKGGSGSDICNGGLQTTADTATASCETVVNVP